VAAWSGVVLESPVPDGHRNEVWAARSPDGRCAVRRSRRSSASLQWELELIEHLDRAGFLVPVPVRTSDGQLSQEEQTAAQANTALVQQIQGIETQISTVQEPMTLAGIYAVEQVAQQLNAAVQQVVQANNVQLILSPGATLYVADPVELTDDILARLNANVTTVSTAVPQGWQPQQSTVQLFQQVQDIRRAIAQQQAAAAAQQQPAATTPVQGR